MTRGETTHEGLTTVQCAQHIQQQLKAHNVEKEASEQIHSHHTAASILKDKPVQEVI